jgi:hypothetical protein
VAGRWRRFQEVSSWRRRKRNVDFEDDVKKMEVEEVEKEKAKKEQEGV